MRESIATSSSVVLGLNIVLIDACMPTCSEGVSDAFRPTCYKINFHSTPSSRGLTSLYLQERKDLAGKTRWIHPSVFGCIVGSDDPK